jgi:cytochrome c biogenesis protein CcmG, thiol:disulfide interchange protein DsbE
VEVNESSVFRYYNGVRRRLLVAPLQDSEKIDAAPEGASYLEESAVSLKRYPDTKRRRDMKPCLDKGPSLDMKPGRGTKFFWQSEQSLLAACLVFALLAALVGCYSGSHPARIGVNAPDFTVQDSDHKVTLSEFHGQVVVLNFWATWCPPCVEETPSLVRMQTRLKPKGVVVLAVSIDEDEDAYHKFLKEYGVNMVTVRDESQKTAKLYGTAGWPESYVIDRQGVIRRKFIGPVDWMSPEVTDYLSKL